jgi:hypothetical protein
MRHQQDRVSLTTKRIEFLFYIKYKKANAIWPVRIGWRTKEAITIDTIQFIHEPKYTS